MFAGEGNDGNDGSDGSVEGSDGENSGADGAAAGASSWYMLFLTAFAAFMVKRNTLNRALKLTAESINYPVR